MSDLVGTPEDRFSQNEAHIIKEERVLQGYLIFFSCFLKAYIVDICLNRLILVVVTNQRTNGPVNDHLISGPRKSTESKFPQI